MPETLLTVSVTLPVPLGNCAVGENQRAGTFSVEPSKRRPLHPVPSAGCRF